MEVMEVRNIAKSFGGLAVLQDVSFDLKSGERVALIGPNGAGKTTFINILSGLLRPTSGSMHFLGRDLTKLTPNRRVALGVSRSFQISSLFPGLSVFENMLMALFGLQKSRYQMFRSFTGYEQNNARAKELLEGRRLVACERYARERSGPWRETSTRDRLVPFLSP